MESLIHVRRLTVPGESGEGRNLPKTSEVVEVSPPDQQRETHFFVRAILQRGQVPGLELTTSGCIAQ